MNVTSNDSLLQWFLKYQMHWKMFVWTINPELFFQCTVLTKGQRGHVAVRTHAPETHIWLNCSSSYWPFSRYPVFPWHCNNFIGLANLFWQGFQVVSSWFCVSRFGIVLHIFHENQLRVGQWGALDCQYRAQNSVENNVLMLDCSNRVVDCRGRYGKLAPGAIVFVDTTSCFVSILYLTIRKTEGAVALCFWTVLCGRRGQKYHSNRK